MTAAWPPWMPPDGARPQLVPAGEWWDAIRAPILDAPAIARCLPDGTTAIRHEGWFTSIWLVPLGAARGWQLPAEVELVTLGQVVVPAPDTAPPHPAAGPPPVWWTAPPTAPITDSAALRRALDELDTASRHGRSRRAR